jgi:hypothetical protein
MKRNAVAEQRRVESVVAVEIGGRRRIGRHPEFKIARELNNAKIYSIHIKHIFGFLYFWRRKGDCEEGYRRFSASDSALSVFARRIPKNAFVPSRAVRLAAINLYLSALTTNKIRLFTRLSNRTREDFVR